MPMDAAPLFFLSAGGPVYREQPEYPMLSWQELEELVLQELVLQELPPQEPELQVLQEQLGQLLLQMASPLAFGGKNSLVGNSMRLNISQGLSVEAQAHSFSGMQNRRWE